MAMNDTEPRRRQFQGRVDDMAQQGPSGQGVQYLGQVGFHPRALASGQDSDTEFHGG